MKKEKKMILGVTLMTFLVSCSSIEEKDVEEAAEYQIQMEEFDKDHAEGTLSYEEMNQVIKEKNEFEEELKEKYPSEDERKELAEAIELKMIELKNK